MNHQLYEGAAHNFYFRDTGLLDPTSFGFELLYFLSTNNLYVLRLGVWTYGNFGMSKAWSAIKDKIDLVNFQVKLMLLFENIIWFSFSLVQERI